MGGVLSSRELDSGASRTISHSRWFGHLLVVEIAAQDKVIKSLTSLGEFLDSSLYKLDRDGKIYGHRVDILAFNLLQTWMTALSVRDLVTAYPGAQSDLPVLPGVGTAFFMGGVVRETLEHREQFLIQYGLAICL